MNLAVRWLTVFAVSIDVLASVGSRLQTQPDDVDRGGYDYLYDTSGNLCLRDCIPGDYRVCYYKFHLEPYTVLGGACGLCPGMKADCYKPQCVTADGYERAILTANRRLPGPSIQVCKGDKVVVDVKNQMPGMSTSIHWHGIRQRLSPWMDGVPMVTQCPIMEGQTFRYHFLADESGTYFWHSHDGLQKLDGVVGSMIIREPDSENVMRALYDWDLASHTILVQDWMHTLANDRLPGRLQKDRTQSPDSYLINGLGIYMSSLYDLYGIHKTQLAEFHVRKGYRYRFRIVSGTCLSCPFRISFQDHKVVVISMDGNPIKPVVVDNLVLSSGERYDVVVHTTKPTAAYWIIVRGLGECRSAMQSAVLRYKGVASKPYPLKWSALFGFQPGHTLNPRNSKCNEQTLLKGSACVSQLQSHISNPPQIGHLADFRIVLPFYFHYFKNKDLFESDTYHKYFVPLLGLQTAGLINNITNAVPPTPLLTQYWDIPPSMFCHEASCVEKVICNCINLIKVPLGSVVEFVLIDTSPPSPLGLTHPFHIHGHDFYIVEQGKLELPLLDFLSYFELRRRSDSPRRLSDYLPSKDTVSVPATGYTVVRILADNPGFWMFHCHFAYHLATGMSAIVQVGELSDMPPPPPHFPKCNEYLPPLQHL